MSDTKASPVLNEKPHIPPLDPPPGKAKRFGRHCRRRWWIYLLFLALIAVIVVPIVLLVAVPKIVQRKVNEATLSVQGISITEPELDSFLLSINTTVGSYTGTKSSMRATVEPFRGQLYLEDLLPHKPFATVDFPQSDANGDGAVKTANITQRVNLRQDGDVGGFTAFAQWLINNQTLRVAVEGQTRVRVRGIARAYPVTFKKILVLNGLNGLVGLNMTSANVASGVAAGEDNFYGYMDIPNPSMITLEIGNATFRTGIGSNSNIGSVTLNNLNLYPGINNASITGRLSQFSVVAAMTRRPICETGIAPFSLVGQNVTYDGVEIPYLANALRGTSLALTVDMRKALEGVGFNISC